MKKQYPCRYVTRSELMDWGISESVTRELVRGLEYRYAPGSRLRLYSIAEVERHLREKLENPRIKPWTRAAVEFALDAEAFQPVERPSADENLEGRLEQILERVNACRSGVG